MNLDVAMQETKIGALPEMPEDLRVLFEAPKEMVK